MPIELSELTKREKMELIYGRGFDYPTAIMCFRSACIDDIEPEKLPNDGKVEVFVDEEKFLKL